MAQSVHAAIGHVMGQPEDVARWFVESNNVVVVAVQGERSLEALADRLHLDGVTVTRFFEPDLDDEMTAIAMIGDDARRACSKLPLAGKEPSMA